MRLLFYNLIFPLAFVLYLPVFVYKLLRRGGFWHHFGERFGLYSAAQKQALRQLDRPVWVHAVSVGEAVAALGFIRRWQERQPGLTFVLSTTTATGHAVAEKKLPPHTALIYCPLDFILPVWRVLRLVRPRMLVIFEVEFWPNLIALAAGYGPVVLANGRMSDRSAQGYARHRGFFGPVFQRFAAFCVQTEDDARRLRVAAGENAPVHVCSTMKFDQTPDAAGGKARETLDRCFGPGERIVWTAGSTHPGEEALAADAFRALRQQYPALRLVLVPRHHERTADVEKALAERQLTYALLKPREGAAAPTGPVDVLLVNATGVLMDYYGASDVVYVGKSLAGNAGGHNIIEPAIFGKPILHGPAMQNFREVAQIFRAAAAAVEVPDDAALKDAVADLLAHPEKRAELGRRARDVVDKNRGAMDRTLDRFAPLLEALPK